MDRLKVVVLLFWPVVVVGVALLWPVMVEVVATVVGLIGGARVMCWGWWW